ncbi:MAG: HAD family hydrolase [Promethearchaeota archaeon]|jgi:phosphoglycolate phosphatase
MIEKEIFENKRVVVFDLDGTIVRLEVDWETLKQTLSKKFIQVHGGNHSFKSVSECLSKIVKLNDIALLESFFKIILQYEMEKIHETRPIEETLFFINNLNLFGVKDNVKMAILSLNMRDTIIKSLEITKIKDHFECIVGREDVRHWKPNPEGLLKIKNYFGARKDEIIYFGDMEKDIITGKNSGIDTFRINDLIKFVKKKKK